MNMDDELLTRSLAALGEDTTEDPDVERHLAAFQDAYAKFEDDSAEAQRVDRLMAEADEDLVLSGALTNHRPERDDDLLERILESSLTAQRSVQHAIETQEKALHVMQVQMDALGEQPQRQQRQWFVRPGTFMSGYTAVFTIVMIVMIAGSVLLGIFGSVSHLGAVLPIIFAATPAVTVLLQAVSVFILARHLRREGNARHAMRLLLGGLSIDRHQVEARQMIATTALRTAAPDQSVEVHAHDDDLYVVRR